MQKTIRFGLFLFLVTGLLLTACEPKPVATNDDTVPSEEGFDSTNVPVDDTSIKPSDTTDSSPVQDSSSLYQDGSYSATGNYVSPVGSENIGVTLVVKNDVVTSVSVTPTATDETSKLYQQNFAKNISTLVTGKRLDEIGPFSAVSGSSLTPVAFNSALESIKADAAL